MYTLINLFITECFFFPFTNLTWTNGFCEAVNKKKQKQKNEVSRKIHLFLLKMAKFCPFFKLTNFKAS